MARHRVVFEIPKKPLGAADVRFIVRRNGTRFGVLEVSNGSIVWFRRNSKKGRKLGWVRFDALMEDAPRRERRKN